MQIEEIQNYPANLPVLVEDELFFISFYDNSYFY